jgi:hypothetical protein
VTRPEGVAEATRRILGDPVLDDAVLVDSGPFGTLVKVCRGCGSLVMPDPVDPVELTSENPAPTGEARHKRWHQLVADLLVDAHDRGVL